MGNGTLLSILPTPSQSPPSLLTEAVCGQCFRWAFNRVIKGGPYLRLIHGTIFVPFLGKRINHAWVENKRGVWDWQMHGRGRKEGLEYVKMWIDDEKKIEKYFRKGFDKKEYYKVAKVKVDDVYDKMEAIETFGKHKHLGPWK